MIKKLTQEKSMLKKIISQIKTYFLHILKADDSPINIHSWHKMPDVFGCIISIKASA